MVRNCVDFNLTDIKSFQFVGGTLKRSKDSGAQRKLLVKIVFTLLNRKISDDRVKGTRPFIPVWPEQSPNRQLTQVSLYQTI